MPTVTTEGLQDTAAVEAATFDAQWAVAAGSADALQATFPTTVEELTDGLILAVRAGAANATATPTFAPDDLTPHTITKLGGVALVAGDIYGAGHELLLRYRASATRWELLNPATQAVPAYYFKALALDAIGSNVNTAQPWFPSQGAVTLPVGTYRFRGRLYLSRSAGSTSHTTAILFGGTATLASNDFVAGAKEGDTSALADLSVIPATGVTTSVVAKAASTSTTEQAFFDVEGIFIVTVAGTVIPQFQYSAAPGGAPTVLRGTFCEIMARTNPSGTWS